MSARFVALVAGVFFFFLAVVTQGILPFIEPSARTTNVTAVVRTEVAYPSSAQECTAGASPLRAGAPAVASPPAASDAPVSRTASIEAPRPTAPAVETPPRRTLGVALGDLLGRFAPLGFLQRNP